MKGEWQHSLSYLCVNDVLDKREEKKRDGKVTVFFALLVCEYVGKEKKKWRQSDRVICLICVWIMCLIDEGKRKKWRESNHVICLTCLWLCWAEEGEKKVIGKRPCSLPYLYVNNVLGRRREKKRKVQRKWSLFKPSLCMNNVSDRGREKAWRRCIMSQAFLWYCERVKIMCIQFRCHLNLRGILFLCFSCWVFK